MKPLEVIMKLTPEAFADENNQFVFHAEKVAELVRCCECVCWDRKTLDEYGFAECNENPNTYWYGDSFCSWGRKDEAEE